MSAPSIPPSLLRSIELVPPDVPAALLLRHAHRSPIKPGTYGDEVPLSQKGIRSAERLGEVLGQRQIGRLRASPVQRCVATAQALAKGARWTTDVVEDQRLGHPGPFVVDPSLAGPLFLELGPMEVVRRQIQDQSSLPGMRPTSEAVSLLLDLLLSDIGNSNTLDVLVTHDSVIAAFVGHVLQTAPTQAAWPAFMDGPLVWRSEDKISVAWMGSVQRLVGLTQ